MKNATKFTLLAQFIGKQATVFYNYQCRKEILEMNICLFLKFL